MLERWLHREKVPAVLNSDLESILRGLGILEDVNSGKVSCAQCGRPMDMSTIQCLYMEDGEVRMCCERLMCYMSITSGRESRRDE